MRVVLSEEDFIEYVNKGYVVKEGFKIWYKKKDLANLTIGDPIKQGEVEFILSDIGFNRIYKILGDCPYYRPRYS